MPHPFYDIYGPQDIVGTKDYSRCDVSGSETSVCHVCVYTKHNMGIDTFFRRIRNSEHGMFHGRVQLLAAKLNLPSSMPQGTTSRDYSS